MLYDQGTCPNWLIQFVLLTLERVKLKVLETEQNLAFSTRWDEYDEHLSKR